MQSSETLPTSSVRVRGWNRKARARATRMLVFVALCIVVVPFVLPFLWMLSTSFKTLDQTLRFPPEWWPRPWQWDNYPRALTEIVPLYRYFWNSVVYSVPATLFAVLSSAVVAYGFAKFRAPGRHVLFMLVLSTLLIPYPVVMVPQFVLFQRLGWIDTYLPRILSKIAVVSWQAEQQGASVRQSAQQARAWSRG